ncbi:MAG: acyl-CoA dehydrogenase, partial [Rhodobacteraceae bacterium]|nr:acyl-CoA dehydrogenase [Paracoccaceae bacterium]MCB2121764.1 acyl-CoA dehydrogenase [Paracoccaceae bacterium]MCB2131084.1 acyl-CoA dehydrogenase [Paracoccaceae bacterium]MCB2137932.1 acyl-CoA dehydrogenase [Paracoccaceae bacterium]
MAHDGADMPKTAILSDLTDLTAAALPQIEAVLRDATSVVRASVDRDGKVSGAALEANQFAAHALSWLATYVESLRQLNAWATRIATEGAMGEMEKLILQIGFGEYLAQIAGGIPMSQGEVARLSDLGVTWTPEGAAATLIAEGNR